MELKMKKTIENICKGLGRIVFSQGLFVIIIVIITALICLKVKKIESKFSENKIQKSELK
jgi:hypothetical protein